MKLLIDGDALIYPPLTANLVEIEEDNELIYASVSMPACRAEIYREVNRYCDLGGSESFVIAFSCPSSECFRKDLFPGYKANRSGRKPLGFSQLKDWCATEFPTLTFPKLEADDILGILQTEPGADTMIVGVDKDFLTIPGTVLSPATGETIEVSQEEADYNHLLQTLTGDSTDGYPGAKGIGPVKAKGILAGGANWDAVVHAFGGDEGEALLQARLSRILRWTDWDHDRRVPILWKPV